MEQNLASLVKSIQELATKFEKLDIRVDTLDAWLGTAESSIQKVSNNHEGEASDKVDNNVEQPKPSVEREVQVPTDVTTLVQQCSKNILQSLNSKQKYLKHV